MKDIDWQVKFDIFIFSMATWTIEYNLKISILFSLHKIRSLDFPINLHIWNLFDQFLTDRFSVNQYYICTVIIINVTKFVCSTLILKFSLFKMR